MGLTQLTLDEGIRTTAVGQLYGLDFEIDAERFRVRVFFDRYNRRLKVLDYAADDYAALTGRLRYLARENDFDKTIVHAARSDWQQFLRQGYVLEGILPAYFAGEDAYVMSRFGSAKRLEAPHLFEETAIVERLLARRDSPPAGALPSGYEMVLAGPEHIPSLVKLYRRVFRTYPSPLTHPDYVAQTMSRHVVYRAVLGPKGEIASAASADVAAKHASAELTDCATREKDRGKGLMYLLLARLEDDLRERGIRTAYTLARAPSAAMNRVFHRLGFEYTGRLLNNCDIAGRFENMNLWVKPLGEAGRGP